MSENKYLVHQYPGYIVLEDEQHTRTPIRSVRCGLSAPNGYNLGGYYCLVGQEQRRLITGHHALMLLEDYAFKTGSQLLTSMFDRMGVYQSVDILTSFTARSFIEQIDYFWRTERPTQEISIRPAPYFNDFVQGVGIISKWLREMKNPDNTVALRLPKECIVREQLREIRFDDLGGKDQEKYYAINGLRYVLADFDVRGHEPQAIPSADEEISSLSWT